MFISDVQNSGKNGDEVEFRAICNEKSVLPKANGGNYMNVSFVDRTGKISFPVFNSIDILDEILEVGKPYTVSGKVNLWNDMVQLKNTDYKIISDEDCEAGEFIDAYQISERYMRKFERMVQSMSEPYQTFAIHATGCCGQNKKLFKEFLLCPSAEKHHGNKIGGLFLHTLGMLEIFESYIEIYSENISLYGNIDDAMNIDRMRLKIILHDFMKIREYEYGLCIKRIPGVIGHIVDGAGYVDNVNENLSGIFGREEIENIKYSILSHHGQWGKFEPKTFEDKLLHLLDMMDSQIVGEIESKN